MDNIDNIANEAEASIRSAADNKGLEELRVKYLGRQGIVAELFKQMANLPREQRPSLGKGLNLLKGRITKLLQEAQQRAKSQARNRETPDPTLPGITPDVGHLHPISKTMHSICGIFRHMGFSVVEGPEIETEYNNFTGLNIPLNHPCRDAFDTFYLKANPKLLLRSHTSPAQIRVMKKTRPPLAVVVPGKVYRRDATDASHSFMFHQVEGFIVDKGITFANLKGVLDVFMRRLFGKGIKLRFRPHFFPFTEPSAEVDVSCVMCRKPQAASRKPQAQSRSCSVCGGKGWLEIMGCGMIHPNVFRAVGYPGNKYTGFAFGMGVERIVMLKYGIDDIRMFFQNDLRMLRQF
ncbi:MAG: phenylalanine--tRNA ligase subunit alpha [Candidatus Omnitrophota bacterium]